MLSSSVEFLSIKCYFIIFFGTSWGNHTSICLAISICWLTSKFSPFSILTKQLYSAQRASKGAVTKWIKLTWLVGGGRYGNILRYRYVVKFEREWKAGSSSWTWDSRSEMSIQDYFQVSDLASQVNTVVISYERKLGGWGLKNREQKW